MAREDGPTNKWAKTVDVRPLGNMPNNPEMQNKLAEMTQQFPTPRVQTDDGNQDVADLHAREDLLLENYSWVDQSQGKVRIPIERAMELIAQRGLPVAPTVEQAPLMTGDAEPTIAAPLTSGFARTAYELDQGEAQKVESGGADGRSGRRQRPQQPAGKRGRTAAIAALDQCDATRSIATRQGDGNRHVRTALVEQARIAPQQ